MSNPSYKPATDTSLKASSVEGGLLCEVSEYEGYRLADWTGGWAPPPVDWEQREAFINSRHRIEQWTAFLDPNPCKIFIGVKQDLSSIECSPENWLARDNNEKAAFKYEIEVIEAPDSEQGSFTYGFAILKGEIADQGWIPAEISEISRDQWWANHLREPSIDSDVLPFWKRFVSPHTLKDLPEPKIKSDSSENKKTRGKWETAKDIIDASKKHKRGLLNDNKNREATPLVTTLAESFLHLDDPNSPKVKMFLRPAYPSDMSQIATIYNDYIENSIFAPEPDSLSVGEMTRRFNEITEARLPFIVAVGQSSKGRSRRGRRAKFEERILGFAFANDFNDAKGMYRYTVEIEIYVEYSCLRLGIGRCLMDKIQIVLDPHWYRRGGYDFIGDFDAYRSGGQRAVVSMLFNFAFDSQDRSRHDWLDVWLAHFDFKTVGELEQIGRKLNTVVSQAQYMKNTGAKIEAWTL